MKTLTMLDRFTILSAVFFLLVFVACKKSNNSGNTSGPNPLTGSWTFTAETSNANITATESLGPISVNVLALVDLRTIDNAGTFTFSADSLQGIGVGYTIDTTYATYITTGGITDTTVSPLMTTVAPTNSEASYQLIGQDSIYFPNGSPFAVSVDTSQPPVEIKGAHFSISGSTLTLTSTFTQTGNETVDGITAPTTAQISSVITMTKQ
jgi:hypothetical protein